jgi:transketolase
MRNTFFLKLTELAATDKNLFFITADLGFGVVEEFRAKYPDRFLNVGVSEQAMLGIAAGMANAGKKVICYSITPFSWLRPFEFFRNGVLASNSSVMVVGVGPGFDYSHDGISHYCFEDLALAQSQPNLHIDICTYKRDVVNALEEFTKNPKPTYVRLPRSEPLFSGMKKSEEIDTNNKSDIIILSYGLMADRAKFFYENYQIKGFSSSIARMTNLDESSIHSALKILNNYKVVHIIEDHYSFGGLATRMSEAILKEQLQVKLINDSVKLMPVGEVGSFSFMESKVFSARSVILQEAIDLLTK